KASLDSLQLELNSERSSKEAVSSENQRLKELIQVKEKAMSENEQSDLVIKLKLDQITNDLQKALTEKRLLESRLGHVEDQNTTLLKDLKELEENHGEQVRQIRESLS